MPWPRKVVLVYLGLLLIWTSCNIWPSTVALKTLSLRTSRGILLPRRNFICPHSWISYAGAQPYLCLQWKCPHFSVRSRGLKSWWEFHPFLCISLSSTHHLYLGVVPLEFNKCYHMVCVINEVFQLVGNFKVDLRAIYEMILQSSLPSEGIIDCWLEKLLYGEDASYAPQAIAEQADPHNTCFARS